MKSAAAPTFNYGRDTLGMGHSIHGLYTVDFLDPKFAWRSVVLMADSYSGGMLGAAQKQCIERVTFEYISGGGVLARVYARHGRISLRPDYAGERLPIPRAFRYRIDFRLDGTTFKVTPETATAATRFGIH